MKDPKDKEILDLVNEKDEIIGEVLKVEANQNPTLWHREVSILIFDESDRLLIQQRSHQKTVQPGRWAVSCAGHVTKGMTIEEAAHMELKEELGFDTNLLFIEKSLYKASNETHFKYWFIGKYFGEKIILEEDEVEQIDWITYKEFQELTRSIDKSTKSLIEYGERYWNGEFSSFKDKL